MNTGLNPSFSVGNVFENVRNIFFHGKNQIQNNQLMRKIVLKSTHTVDYLHALEPHISKDLISTKNYTEIKDLASHFSEGITSFFGFETRLNSTSTRSDYLFAVSSKKGEREALLNLIRNGNLPESFMKKEEWQRVGNLVESWADPTSTLHNKIRGLWLEFDTADTHNEAPVPGIFIHTVPIRIDTSSDIKECSWLTRIALPILAGKTLSKNIEKQLLTAFEKLPENAVVFQAAVMLSRHETGVRIVVMKLKPKQIVSYLKEIGWNGDEKELSALIDDLEKHVTRINLQIQIDESGINPKVGMECNFSPDRLHLETKWPDFLDYLIEKKLCLPEKKSMLLGFAGVEQEDTSYDFSFTTYKIAAKMHDNDFSSALVRYLNHIKINYATDCPLEAKAYPGIRLFGREKDVSYQ